MRDSHWRASGLRYFLLAVEPAVEGTPVSVGSVP